MRPKSKDRTYCAIHNRENTTIKCLWIQDFAKILLKDFWTLEIFIGTFPTIGK